MNKIQADVLVIGGGSAGMGAFRAARKATDNVYIAEDYKFGTTCARVGCMPSKLLIAAAEAAHHAKHTAQFGVHIDCDVRVDGKQVMDRVRAERDRFVGFVVEDVEAWPADKRLLGRAKFKDAHTVIVTNQAGEQTQVSAKRIVIATGSRPVVLPEWQALGERLIINDDVFSWETLPKSVAVFGSGVIGLELGQALARLGVKVHVFGRGNTIGGISDPTVSAKALEIFQQELDMHLDANTRVSLNAAGNVEVAYKQNGEQGVFEAEYLLAAIGRKPNIDNIGLENLPELKLNKRGVPVADRHTMQTSIPHLFIAGDASNQLPLLHEASDQGVIAGKNAGTYPEIDRGLRRSAIGVIFSDPQIMSVGHRWIELADLYPDCGCFAEGEVSFHNQGRSRVMGVNRGMLRVYAEQGSGRFLGAEMIGPAAEHIAHLLAWAHQQKMTVAEMLDMPFYHPVIEEGVRTALRDVNAKLQLSADLEAECAACPGM